MGWMGDDQWFSVEVSFSYLPLDSHCVLRLIFIARSGCGSYPGGVSMQIDIICCFFTTTTHSGLYSRMFGNPYIRRQTQDPSSDVSNDACTLVASTM